MKVYIERAVMNSGQPFPFGGLYNVATEDGRHFIDLTAGQVQSLAAREGWEFPSDDEASESRSA